MPTLPTVILMTSNGVGMGHLSRQLTIALSGADKFRSVIFSLSKALPRVMEAQAIGEIPAHGGASVRYEYCPSRETGWLPAAGWRRSLREKYPSYRWHPYVRDRLLALVREVDARAVVFDGVFPYAGLLQARAALPEVPFVWVRRGMWKSGVAPAQLRTATHFDAVIEPGDFASGFDDGPTSTLPATRVAPVSLTDVVAPLPRAEASAALGLDPSRPALLLAPGSGTLGSVEVTSAAAIAAVGRVDPSWQIAVTRQTIAQHHVGGSNVHLLQNVYPLVRYLSAFDAAVSATGYNSVHELLPSRVPTLFIPSGNHATDDQRRRAEGVAHLGAALVTSSDLTGTAAGEITTAVEALMDASVRSRLNTAGADLPAPTGGREAAGVISRLLAPAPASGVTLARPRRPLVDARTAVGAPAVADTGLPRLLFTDSPTSEQITGPDPIEHVLAGSSPSYLKERRAIAGWLYRPAR